MGYELHITRADLWSENSDRQITREEWQDVLSKDPELKLAGVDSYGPHFAVFANAPEPLSGSWLDWIRGNIVSKYPSSRMVKKMIALAQQLSAKVQGDDGEVYTLDEMHGIDEAFDKKLGYE